MERTITVTGTRATEHRTPGDYTALFAAYLAPFAGRDARFYLGGAVGIDSLALQWLAERTEAGITVVVPDVLDRQPPQALQAIARSRNRVDEVVELGAGELNSGSYHARNRWMVDRSRLAIGFPLALGGETTGTWQTLNYCAQQGKPRLIVPV
ncbi:hypothetical protein ACIHFE_33525 [Streptomyces sp. NPDC052396]|uniref:hypothetical protein n=1 Tax=Streptomyces sp. NPDC052396 TaxID=3365689 RepID=UPI0037D03291